MATHSLVDWCDPAARRWTLLSALYVFTVCTTLRLPGLPVGIGEAGLVATGLAALTLHWRQLAPTLAAYRWLVIFLLVYVALLVIGGLASARAGRLSPGWAHDVAALLFASGTGFLFLLLAGASPVAVQRLQRGVVWVAAALSVLAFLLIVGDYLLGRPVFSPALQANLWWHGRFSAWAMDPNQWGLLLLVAIMLLAMLPGRLSVLLLAVLVWLLLEVRSDAALAGLLAFALVYAGVSLWRRPDARRGALTALAVIVVVFGCFRLVSDHFPPSPVLRVVGAIAGVEPPVHTLKKRQRMRQEGNPVFIGAGGDKLGHRLALWRHSIAAWRVSPVVGLGPGAYSGPQRPFQGQESHNLLMQVLVNTGVAGLLAALAGLSALALLIWRSPATAPWLAVLAGLLAQGMGHYLMRHPLFWLCIALLCWQVEAAARDIGDVPALRDEFDACHALPLSRNPLNPAVLLTAPAAIRALVEAGDYDLVHVHTPVAAFLLRFALRGRSRPRVVYTAHGFHFHRYGGALGNWLFRSAERLAAPWCDALVTINREDFDAAREAGFATRIEYMPGIGVDTDLWDPARVDPARVDAVRAELGLAKDDVLFLMVAEFNPGKRHRDVLAALGQPGLEHVHVAFAGDGPLRPLLAAEAQAAGLGARTHFLGFRRDIAVLMRASRAVLLPSQREGLPRSLLESLSMAVPIVGADIRGIQELAEGDCGRLHRVGDVDGLAAALRELAADSALAAAMGARGRARLCEGYDERAILRLHDDLYTDLLGG